MVGVMKRIAPSRPPVSPASAADSAKAVRNTRGTSMPISQAEVAFCPAARSDRPDRARCA